MNLNSINRDGSMWEIMNVITPSRKKHNQEKDLGYVLPFTDERINAVFPKGTKTKRDNKKDKAGK
jgi:hypothetical protein